MKVFFVLLSVLVLLSSCSSKQQQEPGVKYKTLRVEFTDRTLKNGYAASLRGRQYVEIRPQVDGIITEIRLNEGDVVKKGQVLFIIDQVPYKAALEMAIANVKSAESRLATARLTAESKRSCSERMWFRNLISKPLAIPLQKLRPVLLRLGQRKSMPVIICLIQKLKVLLTGLPV